MFVLTLGRDIETEKERKHLMGYDAESRTSAQSAMWVPGALLLLLCCLLLEDTSGFLIRCKLKA